MSPGFREPPSRSSRWPAPSVWDSPSCSWSTPHIRDEALRIEVPATYVGRPWPAPFIAVVLLGFATAQAVVVWLGEQFSSRGRAAMHVGILLTGVIPVLFARHQIGLTAGIYDAQPPETDAVRACLGAVAALAAVAVVTLALLGRTRLSAIAACTPLIVLSGIWVVCEISGSAFAGSSDHRFDATLPLGAPIALSVVLTAIGLAGAGLVITLWQVALGTRAVVDGSTATTAGYSRAIRRLRRAHARADVGAWLILAVIVAVKLGWMALCVAGVLPRWLGGDLSVSQTLRSDGWLSRGLAATIAAAACVWLVRGTPGAFRNDGLVSAVAVLVVGLSLPELVFQALAMAYAQGAGEWAFDAASRVEGLQPWAPVVVIVGSLLVGGWRWRSGRRDAGTLALLFVGLWGVVRVPALVDDLLRYPWYPWGLSMPAEATYGQHAGWVELATVDAAITVAVLGVACAAAARWTAVRLVPRSSRSWPRPRSSTRAWSSGRPSPGRSGMRWRSCCPSPTSICSTHAG